MAFNQKTKIVLGVLIAIIALGLVLGLAIGINKGREFSRNETS